MYKDREDKMECRKKETVKEKGKENGKSRNERKRLKGTWGKKKQRKKGGAKESLNFHPTSIINELFFDLLENSRLVNKQGVRAVTHTVLTSAVVRHIDSKVYWGRR